MVISSPTKNFFYKKCVIIPQKPYSSEWIHFISSLMVCLIHWNRNGSNTGMRVNHDSMQKWEPKILVRTGHGFHNNEFLIPISNLKKSKCINKWNGTDFSFPFLFFITLFQAQPKFLYVAFVKNNSNKATQLHFD